MFEVDGTRIDDDVGAKQLAVLDADLTGACCGQAFGTLVAAGCQVLRGQVGVHTLGRQPLVEQQLAHGVGTFERESVVLCCGPHGVGVAHHDQVNRYGPMCGLGLETGELLL